MDSRDPQSHAAMLAQVDELLSKCSISEDAVPTCTPKSVSGYRQLDALTGQISLPKDPFKQSTLLLSRLDRQRLKGKRKPCDDSENEFEGEALSGDPRTSQISQFTPSPKRARTEQRTDDSAHPYEDRVGPVDLPIADVDNALHHPLQLQDGNPSADVSMPLDIHSFEDLGDMIAVAQLGPFEEEDKENWDPSSGFGSDSLLGDIRGYPCDGSMVVEGDTNHMFAHGIPEDQCAFDSQMPLDGPELKQYAEAGLVTDTQHWEEYGQWKGAPLETPMPVLRPSPLVASERINADGPHQNRHQTASSSPSIPRIDPARAKGLFSHSLGLFEFARLRSVKMPPPPQLDNHDMSLERHQPPAGRESRPLEDTPPAKQALPPEIMDSNTIPAEEVNCRVVQPSTVHRYLASLEILQKRALVKSLSSADCFIDLIERTSLGGAHIIVDPSTAILFIPLLTLGTECMAWIERVSAQSWKFKIIYVVLEAYPETCAFKSRERRSELSAYTPPILKAIKKFRRDIGLAEAFNTKSTGCKIKFGFADCVADAARFARYAGDVAEAGDTTGGEIWGDRECLEEEHEVSTPLGHLTYIADPSDTHRMNKTWPLWLA